MTSASSRGRTTSRDHIVGLDIIRLLAAVLVMAYHMTFWNWTMAGPFARLSSADGPIWGTTLSFGWVGVEVFFVISGFVIAYSASRSTGAAFLRGRVLRLAPVSWIAATLAFALMAISGTKPLGTLVRLYGETVAFWPLDAIDGVWWTLGIEISFYALAYALIARGRAHSLERVISVVGIGSGLFWLTALGLETGLSGCEGRCAVFRGLVLRAEGNRELQLLLVQHGCLFGVGVVLWAASTFGLTRRRAWVLAVLTSACLLEIVGQNGIIVRASQIPLSPLPALLTWLAVTSSLIACVVWNDGLFRRLGHGVTYVRVAGISTYPLYLMHNSLGVFMVAALTPWIGLPAVGVAMVIACLVAVVTAVVVEPRCRRLLSMLLTVGKTDLILKTSPSKLH